MSVRLLFRCLLLVFLLSTHSLTHAAFQIDVSKGEVRLNACVSLLEDPSGAMTVGEVLRPANLARFAPAKAENVLHLGLSRSAWWLRCDLDISPEARQGLLEIGLPYLDQVDVHFVRSGQVIASARAGDMRPYSQRPIASHRFVFPPPRESGEISLYVRVQSSSLVIVPLRWLSRSQFDHVTDLDLVVLSAYWGVLFALCMYNLFLFFAVRAWSFLHYILSSGAYSLALLCVLGFGTRYFWPETPSFNNAAIIIALFVAGIFGLFFAASFFSTAKRTPRIHRWLLGTAVVEAIGIPLTLASTAAGEMLLGLVSNVGVVLLFTVVIQGIRDKVPGGRPFLVAIVAQVLVSLSQAAQSFGVASLEYWTSYSVQLGSAGMVMFFALGIAVRLNAIKTAKEEAQLQALTAQQLLVDSLRDNERVLETRVEQRTQELAEVNTVLRQREQQLVDLLHHDTLTGAATRILFEDRLTQAMARCSRNQRLVALMLIDLDGFKAVNDTYGHDAGDAVLIEVTRRFKNVLRGSDTVGRLGGDEFILIIDELKSPDDVVGIAEKILREAALPVAFKGHSLSVGASVGIAFCPLDAKEMNALLKAADHAMYAAKAGGKGCWRMAGQPGTAG